MTIFRARQARQARAGKVLSGDSVSSVKQALGHLKGLLESAGEDDDVEAITPGSLAGPTGDLSNPNQDNGAELGNADGTRMSRPSSHRGGSHHPQTETRG